jgi:Domain of unknown function (DUF4412)
MYPNIKNNRQFKSLIMTITLSGLLSLLACLSGCSPGTSTSGSQFEGVITVKYYDFMGLDRGIFSFKESLYRSETVKKRGVTDVLIVDYKTGIGKDINQTEKTYLEIDPRDIGKSIEKLPKFTPTGKTETIAGYTCENYVMMDDPQKTSMCFAEGLGYIGSAGDFYRSGVLKFLNISADDKEISARMDSDPVLKKLIETGAYPLKTSGIVNGWEIIFLETISIERKSLDDSLFQVPAGYKKVELPLLRPESKDKAGK